jgi:hypothetical protein
MYDLEKDILIPVISRLRNRTDSLRELSRFAYTMGFEGWLKVEVIAALGEEVVAVQNKGPDLMLKTGLEIELKCANNLSSTWIGDGALKYGCPCLFLGDGSSGEKIAQLDSASLELVGYEIINDEKKKWVVGIVIPKKHKAASIRNNESAAKKKEKKILKVETTGKSSVKAAPADNKSEERNPETGQRLTINYNTWVIKPKAMGNHGLQALAQTLESEMNSRGTEAAHALLFRQAPKWLSPISSETATGMLNIFLTKGADVSEFELTMAKFAPFLFPGNRDWLDPNGKIKKGRLISHIKFMAGYSTSKSNRPKKGLKFESDSSVWNLGPNSFVRAIDVWEDRGTPVYRPDR